MNGKGALSGRGCSTPGQARAANSGSKLNESVYVVNVSAVPGTAWRALCAAKVYSVAK